MGTETINPDPLCFIYKRQVALSISKNVRLSTTRIQTLDGEINTVRNEELKNPQKCQHQKDDGSRSFTCPHKVNGKICKSYFCEHYTV